MRFRAKVDANQAEIVLALRAAGATVRSTATIGKGVPDIIAGYQGRNYLFEIKSGRGQLTPDEVVFFKTWQGQVVAVYSAEDALRVIGAV